MNNYKLQAPYEPNGDQPKAIKKLVQGVDSGKQFQTLLGATGTGKTFTIANVIQQTGRPALILAHNKTLAAQLCNELRQFSLKMLLNTLSLTMIIISQKLMCPRLILTSKKMLPLTITSSKCGFQQPKRF